MRPRIDDKVHLEMTQRLYMKMPGAKRPPIEDGWFMWGKVEHTDAWEFCAGIAEEILTAIQLAAAAKSTAAGISPDRVEGATALSDYCGEPSMGQEPGSTP